jgi:hypothetical protein
MVKVASSFYRRKGWKDLFLKTLGIWPEGVTLNWKPVFEWYMAKLYGQEWTPNRHVLP